MSPLETVGYETGLAAFRHQISWTGNVELLVFGKKPAIGVSTFGEHPTVRRLKDIIRKISCFKIVITTHSYSTAAAFKDLGEPGACGNENAWLAPDGDAANATMLR
jgi:hypothetical protein